MTVRLLLVEDDPTTRTFLCAASAALPARVDTADSVASALSQARRHDHALWMIDAHLPDGSGSALLSMLRAEGLATPALAHTATDTRDELDALLAAGFIGAVAKPLTADAWRSALRAALGQTPTMPTGGDAAAGGRVAAPPVWDDAGALAAMGGQRAHVDALRTMFLAELSAVQASMSRASAAAQDETLQAELHRLQASCGFVGAARLAAAVRELRAAPQSAVARARFEAALQDTLSS